MSNFSRKLWQFFASVKLALATLFILATISIIGTLIEQKKLPEFYIDEYGESLAQIFQLLGFTSMYSSWWFIALLLLFALNLVVCSIERLPGVWKTVVQDNLIIDPEQLKKMNCSDTFDSRLSITDAGAQVRQVLADNGWKRLRSSDGTANTLIFAQQGAWSRLAVYVVHLSILIVLAGAAIGTLFGFEAYVFLPEGRSTERVFLQKNREPIPLGFELHCDRAQLSFYPNGMISEYRADLTVIDPQRTTPYHKSTIVNDPLNYRGIAFYLGDFHPLEEYFIIIGNRTTGAEHAFRVPAEREFTWPGTEITARIEELIHDVEGTVQEARISFSIDAATPATEFWVENNQTVSIGQGGQDFSLNFRQLSSVLLLVNKDPGVMIVYAGFILMMIGLLCSFLLSHRRVWISLSEKKSGCRIVIGGNSNKHRPGFEKTFRSLVESIREKVKP